MSVIPESNSPPTGKNNAGRAVRRPKTAPQHLNSGTPLADAHLKLVRRGCHNLHAMPLSAESIVDSPLRAQFEELFGAEFLKSDSSLAGPLFGSVYTTDTSSPLVQSQELTARAYGSDAVLYSTNGTSTSNLVMVSAAVKVGVNFLVVDRRNHSSIHTAVHRAGVPYRYASTKTVAGREVLDVWSLVATLEEVRALYPDVEIGVILSGAGYGDTVLDTPRIIRLINSRVAVKVFLIDEAWSASHAFLPRSKKYTALDGVRRLREERPNLPIAVMVTHSVHKSMSALRQMSWIHFLGDDGMVSRLRAAAGAALFEHHTTSPSLPILSSGDLARAQMAREGAKLLRNSLARAAQVRRAITSDPALNYYRLMPDLPRNGSEAYVVADPTKLLVDIRRLNLSSYTFKRMLFERGVHVSWVNDGRFLAHITIGASGESIDALIHALTWIAENAPNGPTGDISDGLLIPYPPGVPVLAPGERITDSVLTSVQRLRDSGVEMHWVRK